MQSLLVLIIVIAILWTVSWLKRQPPAKRQAAGFKAALVAAGVLLFLALVTGKLNPLVALLAAAIPMLQRLYAAKSIFDRLKSARGPAPGNTSSVNTRFIEMTLDHDSGEMSGTVREGRFAGRSLSGLDLSDLLMLLGECRTVDAQSAAVLEAYLERYHGDAWRDEAAATHGAGQAPGRRSGPMTDQEAREVLGVPPNAGREEILAAHRRLMQKLHPDRGGSDYLAAKINQAKDCLLTKG